jgi:hypothetical protein
LNDASKMVELLQLLVWNSADILWQWGTCGLWGDAGKCVGFGYQMCVFWGPGERGNNIKNIFCKYFTILQYLFLGRGVLQ